MSEEQMLEPEELRPERSFAVVADLIARDMEREAELDEEPAGISESIEQ